MGIALLYETSEFRIINFFGNARCTTIALEEHDAKSSDDDEVQPIEVETGHIVFLLILHFIVKQI
ncbi:hypothetical protein EVA_09880 [gut metagenome]|uniref:Uncharacterized protein n=1 Tax=gut metagenome TaxID=749906 RepID=J9GPV1_9ZZZZ